MLCLEEIERNRAGVMGLEELATLLCKVRDARGGDGLISFGVGTEGANLLVEQFGKRRRIGRGGATSALQDNHRRQDLNPATPPFTATEWITPYLRCPPLSRYL